MSPRRVRAITVRILSQFRRDRRTLALIFVAPILILSLLGYLLRGPSVQPKIYVVDQDRTPTSARVVESLEQSTLITARSIRSRRNADTATRDGEAAGYVVIDQGFAASMAEGQPHLPVIVLEGTQPSQSANVIAAVRQALGSLAPQSLALTAVYLHGAPGLDILDYFGAGFIGVAVFFLVFVITSVSFLRERVQGTLERLMASPLRRTEIVLGYMLGFTVAALVQGIVILLFVLYVLRVYNAGNPLLVFLIEALLAIAAVNLGIFLSMFARTEFQAVQFIPLVIVPQLLLSGILFPVASEPLPLQYASNMLPLTYAVYAMHDVMLKGAGLTSSGLLLDIAVLIAFIALLIAAAVATLRRRIA